MHVKSCKKIKFAIIMPNASCWVIMTNLEQCQNNQNKKNIEVNKIFCHKILSVQEIELILQSQFTQATM